MAKKYHKTYKSYKKGAKRVGAKQVATRKEFKQVKSALERKYAPKFKTTRTKTVLEGLKAAGLTEKEIRALRGH